MLILQTAFLMPSLPETDLFPFFQNPILQPSLLCCAFALGLCIPWKRNLHIIFDFDLLIPAAVVFLLPGREYLMFFCAGSLLRMNLADDADQPMTLTSFAIALCCGLWGYPCMYWLFGDPVCWLLLVFLLLVSIFCNHFYYLRETRFVTVIPFLILIVGIVLAYPQIVKKCTAPQQSSFAVETEDFEMLPLVALQVFSDSFDNDESNLQICAADGSFSASLFKQNSIMPHPGNDCCLYYYELPLPQTIKDNICFTRGFYESVLSAAGEDDALLVVRIPVPRSDPREKQIAAVVEATLPGKTAQLHGPGYRYLVVKKDGALPDLSPERLLDSGLDMEWIASYTALQNMHRTDSPGEGRMNTQTDPQLLAFGLEQEKRTVPFELIRDHVDRYLPWCFIVLLVIYLLCRYFINWSPGHKPVFHFIEKGICCGGAAACYFAEWSRAPGLEYRVLFLLAGGSLLQFYLLPRIKNRLIAAAIFIAGYVYCVYFTFIGALPFLVFLLMYGVLILDHASIRARFYLREEQEPCFYGIAIFTGAVSFTVISFIQFLLPGLADIPALLLLALILWQGICSLRAGKGRKCP